MLGMLDGFEVTGIRVGMDVGKREGCTLGNLLGKLNGC